MVTHIIHYVDEGMLAMCVCVCGFLGSSQLSRFISCAFLFVCTCV